MLSAIDFGQGVEDAWANVQYVGRAVLPSVRSRVCARPFKTTKGENRGFGLKHQVEGQTQQV